MMTDKWLKTHGSAECSCGFILNEDDFCYGHLHLVLLCLVSYFIPSLVVSPPTTLSFFSPSLSISHIQRFSEMLKLAASISVKNTRSLQTGSRGCIQDFTNANIYCPHTYRHTHAHTPPLLLFINTLRHRPAHRSINREIQRQSRAFWSASVGVAPLAA